MTFVQLVLEVGGEACEVDWMRLSSSNDQTPTGSLAQMLQIAASETLLVN